MDIPFIRNDKDHRRVLTEIERSWEAEPGTPEHDRRERLAILAKNDYEDRRWPILPRRRRS